MRESTSTPKTPGDFADVPTPGPGTTDSAIAAHFALGISGQQSGDVPAAMAAFKQVLTLDANHVPSLVNLGALHLETGQLAAAESRFRRALAQDPKCFEAAHNLAAMYHSHQKWDAAVAAYSQALQLQPQNASLINNLGNVFASQQKLESAAKAFQAAVRCQPQNLLAHLRLDCLSPTVFSSTEEIGRYRLALNKKLASYVGTHLKIDLAQVVNSGCKPPFCLASHGLNDRPLKEQMAQVIAARLPKLKLPQQAGKGPPRLGMVVTRGHEGVFLRCMQECVRRLPGLGVQVVIAGQQAAVAHLLKKLDCPGIEGVALSEHLATAPVQLSQSGCDVLYYWEIGTDSLNYFLPFYRCAPVQCTSWGWPVTSGIPAVDCFLTAAAWDPAGCEEQYTEEVVRLAAFPQGWQMPSMADSAATRGEFGLPAQSHLYLCCQNPRKLHPEFDGVISRLLQADPRGLVLLVEAAEAQVTQLLKERLQQSLSNSGTFDRVRFVPRQSAEKYRRLLCVADAIIDTPHYGGGANTTLESLAAGPPLVAWQGTQHRGRFAAAALQMLGWQKTVAQDEQSFINAAIQSATDRDLRAEFTEVVTQRLHVLAHVESAAESLASWVTQQAQTTRG